jgi:hypothetical protein
MKIEIFTFCDFAQEVGGKLTVVGTFDSIVARSFPCVHPNLFVAIRLRFDIWEFGAHEFRIEARDVDDKPGLHTINGTLNVYGSDNSTAVSHLIFGVTNLTFSKPGVVNFILFIDNKEAASIPLYLKKMRMADG